MSFAFAVVFVSFGFSSTNASTILTEQAKRAEIIQSFKGDLKGYLHDFFGQPSNLENHGTYGTYFKNSDPHASIILEKLYINVKGGENLKTKDDVEKFINGSHEGRYLAKYGAENENGQALTVD